MERETLTLTTKNKHVITYCSYATGREARAIEEKYLISMDMGMQNGTPTINKVDPTAPFQAEKEAIRLLVKSIDGKTDNVVELALDLRQEDYEQVVAALNEVTKKKA